MTSSSPQDRIKEYAGVMGLKITGFLGDGTDGYVVKSDRVTAIKAFAYKKNYIRELLCYQRLKENDVRKIGKLSVPRLVDYHDKLWVVEMGIVTPPCVLDFGKAYLDRSPDFSAEIWREHFKSEQEIWEDRYPEVQAIVGQLKQYGILYYDTSPKNIQLNPIPGTE